MGVCNPQQAMASKFQWVVAKRRNKTDVDRFRTGKSCGLCVFMFIDVYCYCQINYFQQIYIVSYSVPQRYRCVYGNTSKRVYKSDMPNYSILLFGGCSMASAVVQGR